MNITSNVSYHKTKNHLERKEHLPEIKNQNVACIGLLNLFVHLQILDINTAELQRRIQALDMRCHRTIFGVS